MRALWFIGTALVIGGVSTVGFAQSAGKKDDPYKAYYSGGQPADGASMQGGPLAAPMPAQVRRDMGYTAQPAAPAQNTNGWTPAPAPAAPASSQYNQPYSAPSARSGGSYYGAPSAPAAQSAPQYAPRPAPSSTTTYGGYPAGGSGQGYSNTTAAQASSYQGGQYQPQSTGSQNGQYQGGQYQGRQYQGGQYQGGQYSGQYAPNSGPYSGPNTSSRQAPQMRQKRSIWQRLGFGNVEMKSDGHVKMGLGAVSRDDWTSELVADGMVRTEISAITQGGIEYGVKLKLRGQRDRYRRGFGGSTMVFGTQGCEPGIPGCATVTLDGAPRAARGYTSRLYSFGDNEQKEQQIALEGANIFVRTPYGDFTAGRDDGAAALFSSQAPSLMPLARASNLTTDYSGLDMTKTLNDASGFAEKVTYTSPRLLGDMIGVGVQFGASYAPSTEVCGVDYCVRGNDRDNPNTPLSPQLEDAFELGLALSRNFDNGLGFEAVVNYATATDSSGLTEFDDLQSWGTGLTATYGDFQFGTSYLSSNNGWADDGDYQAADIGLTWKPAQWGITTGLGWAQDDLTGVTGRSALLGLSYEFDRYTLGTGIQYTDRDVRVSSGTVVTQETQDAAGIFIEGAVKF